MEKYLTSPFYYDETMEFDIIIQKKPKKVNLQGNEVSIIRALAKYKLLNKRCIKEAVHLSQPQNRHRDSYDTELGLLFKGGYIVKYQYPDQKSGRANVVLYALSAKGIAYAKEKDIKVPVENIRKDATPVFDTPAALEIASLNAWHIRLLTCYKGRIGAEIYDKPVTIDEKTAIIPSCVTIKNNKSCIYPAVTAVTVAFKKTETAEAMGSFLNKILALNLFSKRYADEYQNPVVIVITESFTQIERAAIKMQLFKPLENLQVYYTIDEYINKLSPLEYLYSAKNDIHTATTRYALINLLQRKDMDNDTK